MLQAQPIAGLDDVSALTFDPLRDNLQSGPGPRLALSEHSPLVPELGVDGKPICSPSLLRGMQVWQRSVP